MQGGIPNSRTSTASLASGRLTKNRGGLRAALKYVPMSLCSSGQLINATTGRGGVLSSAGSRFIALPGDCGRAHRTADAEEDNIRPYSMKPM
jgi:hypothetical protein